MLGGGEMNELMSTKMCSPLIIYLVVLVVSGLSIYCTRDALRRYDTQKMDNLYQLYSLQELKLAIVLGVILYGLCQYNKTTLAWVFLIFPIIYIIIQNLIVHIYVATAYQNAPKAVDLKTLEHIQSQHYGLGSGAQIVPKDSLTVPSPKKDEHPVTSQPPSQPLTGSQGMGGLSGGGLSGGGLSGGGFGGVSSGFSGGADQFNMF